MGGARRGKEMGYSLNMEDWDLKGVQYGFDVINLVKI